MTLTKLITITWTKMPTETDKLNITIQIDKMIAAKQTDGLVDLISVHEASFYSTKPPFIFTRKFADQSAAEEYKIWVEALAAATAIITDIV